MPLEDLITVIERLRERIQQQGGMLSQSEMLTRYVLIDPLLRALGWDTEDPTLVRPEYQYQYGRGRADYVLFSDGKPEAVIEAKKLNESMSGDVISQTINYCLQEGTPYFVITDGRLWDVYETLKPGPIEQKKIHSLDLTHETAAQVSLRALGLWNQAFGDHASNPILVPESSTNSTELTPTATVVPTLPKPPLPEEFGASIVTLSKLNSEASSYAGSRGGSPPPKPKELLFPDKTSKAIKNWSELLREVASWLILHGKLRAADCPINAATGARYLINLKPEHSTGVAFTNFVKLNMTSSGEQLYLTLNWDTPDTIRNAYNLTTKCGEDPSKFAVKF